MKLDGEYLFSLVRSRNPKSIDPCRNMMAQICVFHKEMFQQQEHSNQDEPPAKITGVDMDITTNHVTPEAEHETTDQVSKAPVIKKNLNPIQRHYDLRNTKRTPKPVLRLSPSMDGKAYKNVTLTQLPSTTETHNPSCGVMSICMTQYSLKKGIDKFGVRAENAIKDELRQLHDRGSFLPVKNIKSQLVI